MVLSLSAPTRLVHVESTHRKGYLFYVKFLWCTPTLFSMTARLAHAPLAFPSYQKASVMFAWIKVGLLLACRASQHIKHIFRFFHLQVDTFYTSWSHYSFPRLGAKITICLKIRSFARNFLCWFHIHIGSNVKEGKGKLY